MSEEILIARSAIQVARELRFLTNRVTKPLQYEEYIPKLMNSLEIQTIKYMKLRIATILQPLVAPFDIDLGGEFWLSSEDLKSGYVPLYKDGKAFLPTHVLFLVDHEGDFVTGKIYPGKIIRWIDAQKILVELPSVPISNIGVLYARKIIKKSNYRET